jgi:hypothetical protein
MVVDRLGNAYLYAGFSVKVDGYTRTTEKSA